MKRTILTLVLAIVGFGLVSAQDGLKASAHIGIPSGDSGDFFNFNLGADATYMFPVLIDGLSVGGKAGIELFSGKNIPNTNLKNAGATYIPIAVTGEYLYDEKFFGALDLGFALSLKNDYKSGLYFMPKVGMRVMDEFDGFLFLKAITSEVDSPTHDDSKFSSVMSFGIGGSYRF